MSHPSSAGPSRPAHDAVPPQDWARELKRYAAERLPAYLVPDVVMVLDGLPTTANGKIDRKALAAVEALPGPATGRAPRTEPEKALCALFAEVLRLPEVGVDTDFFAVGGNSLLAMRLVWRIRVRLGYELSVQEVFEAPTVALLAPRLTVGGTPAPALERRAGDGAVPLSPAQRRLWFLNRLDSGSTAYNIPLPLRLRGRLDPDALSAALADVVERHEALRTVFPESGGEPRQVVLESAEACPGLERVRLDPDRLAEEQARFERRGFDLRGDPPLRARLVRLAEEEHVLLLVVHHIACDGWSLAPLARDLGAAYTARVRRETAELPPLAVQYRDFTLWQRDLLGDPDDAGSLMSRQLAFWTDALAGSPEKLALPADRPRPARSGHRGDTVDFEIGPELTAAIDRLAAESGASAFMVVQAALAAVLTRLGAGYDIPVGTPVAGRAHEALDDLVGFFANTLVLRADTSGDPGFRELLARVRAFAFQAFAHQDLPFDVLVEALNPRRDPAHHPLFQVMLVFENNTRVPVGLPGLEAAEEPCRLGVARFDLVFNLTPPATPGAGGTRGFVEYATDLFDRDTVERIAGYLVATLERVLADPDLPLSRLDMRSPAERARIEAWNATGRPVPAASLPDLFEAQVARTPDRAAVVHSTGTLTFTELNARANRLARDLVRLGAGPEKVVALALPRSPDVVVALWAVLKTGAAYLPVDLGHPAARVRAMLEDATPLLVLTSVHTAERLPAGVAPLCVDDPELVERIAALDAADLTDADRRAPLRPGHPLYVIHTSGSTGRPKGVVMPAAPIVNLLAWHAEVMPAEPDSVTAQFASLSFDPAAQEILSAGTSGKTLAVPAEDVRRSPADLARWLDRHRVTELFAPTALIELLCQEALRLGLTLPRLRHVAQGGEALVLSDAVRAFFDAVPGRRLHNYYGPTETHAATAHTVDRPVSGQPAQVPIGGPIWNTRIHLVDDALRPVPLGVPGEVCVAGAAVARGYLDRPAETAQRFVPDPFGPPGGRMYRTGDLARLRADGQLEYLGRNDFQVKIRGFRIEPGEVEEALRQAPAVARAVVTAVDAEHGGKRLIGYVVPRQGRTVDPASVRAFVAERLPGYMVPAALVVLDELPVNPNGKVDRLALPAPAEPPAAAGRPPRTGRERELCRITAELLGRSQVGVTDDFFEIGGHSLLVTRLIDDVRLALGLELPVRSFFDEPTVEGMARRLAPVARQRPVLRRRTGHDTGRSG
ncbi:amino acid adenylation domain-containing protein [Streptomyces sp. NPDC093260]|uniref:amino acid adenylation domain-containing protein n=1 Tax=Streptomyces sp. NPDC093260 TaxID=3155073 RepID=UPI003425231D